MGWGTIEIITGPFPDLHRLAQSHTAAMRQLHTAATALGMRVLGYGAQPRTPPSLNLMSARHRYRLMYECIGEPWLWFTVTASDQVTTHRARQSASQYHTRQRLRCPPPCTCYAPVAGAVAHGATAWCASCCRVPTVLCIRWVTTVFACGWRRW